MIAAFLFVILIEQDLSDQLLTIKRVFVDKLTGGETAAQMRDLIISSLQNTKLFILTENQERADAFIRGAAEDLIYTDSISTSDAVNVHSNASESTGSNEGSRYNNASSGIGVRSGRSMGVGLGEDQSTSIKERKHEAMATVRLVNKDGDVVWSTTQESNGAKFHGASADVADKITRQLIADHAKARKPAALEVRKVP